LTVDLKIDWATHAAAKYACENWHYSGVIPKSKLVKFGVWEDGRFVGVVIYGVGATSSLVRQYDLESQEGCELVRVALKKHKSEVSKIVSLTLRLLKRAQPGLRLVVSFADPEQGHHGGVYQAMNWVFTGNTQPSMEYEFQGRRWQGRSFRNSHKGLENSPEVRKVMGSSKYRYLMPLDKEMRERIEPLRKPYPKRPKQATSPQGKGGGAAPTRTLQKQAAE